jgi:hypothetical protein
MDNKKGNEIMDHGMFSSAGNREVSRIIEIAREYSLDFDEVMYLLNELARFEKYAEATDTVVRETVGEALGFYA